jgi:hypothetical protein
VVTLILAIVFLWLALSVAAGLLFARLATLNKRSEVPVDEAELAPQIQLVPAAPPSHEHVA